MLTRFVRFSASTTLVFSVLSHLLFLFFFQNLTLHMDLAVIVLLIINSLNFRIDTHAMNKRMQGLIKSTGFSNLEMLKAAREVTGKEIPAEIAGRRGGDP